MDSKQLVNDIVNKRFSQARKIINEEMTNRVLNHIESKKSDVINEALSFEPGVIKTAAAGLAGAAALGVGAVKGVKALHKRFGVVGRSEKKKEKEEKKKGKAEAKKNIAWLKGPSKTVNKLESKLHKPGRGVDLTDQERKENQKIQDRIDDIRDKFDSEWAKSHKKDVKKGRIEAGPGKSAKKQKKIARSERDKEDEPKDESDIETQKKKLDKQIGKKQNELQNVQKKMQTDALSGKDVTDQEKENIQSIQSDLDSLVSKREELEPSEEDE